MKSSSKRQRGGADERRNKDRTETKRRVEFDRGSNGETLARQYGVEVSQGQHQKAKRLVQTHGREKVRRWAGEGMSVETMGKPREMAAFRKSDGSSTHGLESAEQSDPTAGMCSRCTRRYKAGKSIDDCPECKKELHRARGTDESVLRSSQSVKSGEIVQRGRQLGAGVDTAVELGPGVAGSARQAADRAKKLSEEIADGGKFLGPQDAARHCLWMCFLTKQEGRETALQVGQIYEDNSQSRGKERRMDLHNNKAGADCADSECKSCCKGKLDGELIIVDPATDGG